MGNIIYVLEHEESQITESKYHCNFDENLMQKWTSLLQVELLLISASYD